MPEEDKSDPPRAASGSQQLPWDNFSISTKAVCPPGVGSWGGERASAKAADGGSLRGGRSNATAKIRNAGRRCDAGRRPSVSRSGVPGWRGGGSMPRRNGSDANGRQSRPRRPRKARSRRALPKSLRVVTQEKNIRKFFATARAVTSLCGNRTAPRLATVATSAAPP